MGVKLDIASRWFHEVWNEKRDASIDELLAPDAHAYGLGPAAMVGPDGFRTFHRAFVSAFPDIQVKILNSVEQGEMVAVQCLASGTHSGPGLGFDPTGRAFSVEGMSLLRIRDGKVVEGWNYYDFLSLYRQIGAPDSVLRGS
jgi:steroid delta-isomerase-like uncharacterized protein